MAKATLYLLLGLPGSGKTTAAREISKLTGAIHLSSDTYRLSLFKKPIFTQTEHDELYKKLDEECARLLNDGTSVVYDANLNRFEHRSEKYQLARHVQAESKLLWLMVPKGTAKQRRLATQTEVLVPAGETPDTMFDRIADIFEPPHKNEAYIALDGTKITTTYVTRALGLVN